MSKAIRISNKIKTQNTHLNWVVSAEIGDIIIKSDYPNKFNVTEHVSGGYKSREDLHFNDGWRPFIRTDYDNTTQKEKRNNIVKQPDGASLEDTTHYTYKIVDLSQEQIDSLVLNNEETAASFKLDEHVENGEELFRSCYRKIWRRRHKDSDATNKLTQNEERTLMEWFAPVFNFLKLGNFHLAKKEINKVRNTNSVELNLVAGMNNTAIWLEDQILDYFNNQYDL